MYNNQSPNGASVYNLQNTIYRPTRFLVSNCQKKKSATLVLNKNCNILENIVAITEPWVGKQCKCTFQAPWKVICTTPNPRAALIVPPWADAFLHTSQSDRDSVFCSVKIGSETIIIGVIYAENGLIDLNKWTTNLNALQAICPKMVIFADSNAHSTLWGYPKSDQKGKRWEDLLGSTDLEVFTTSYATTFRNSRNFSSCIDIAFGTPNMKPKLSDRILNPFPSASDHLSWGLDLSEYGNTREETFWKLKAADWEKVTCTLHDKIESKIIPNCSDKGGLDAAVTILTSSIKETMDLCIKKQLKKPNQRWWNRDLSDLQNRVSRESNPNTKAQLTKEFEEKCLEAQAANWKEFATNCNSVDGAFLKKKLIGLEKRHTNLQSLIKDDGSVTTSGPETAEYLLGKWFRLNRDIITDRLEDLEQNIYHKFPTTNVDTVPMISLSEVECAVSGMKPFSAAGPDDIPIIVIQKTLPVLGPLLVRIFNGCLELGYTPMSWKIGKTILIPKSDRRHNNHKDYRPITLLSGFVKILEKIILLRLQKCAEIGKWISNKQYAFQAGRSVNQALIQYSSRISTGIKTKTPTIAIHLDIEGAFNSVWLPVLIDRLYRLGCPSYLINWCFNYLSNRQQMYKSSSYTVEVQVEKSTPQGGSLSPFFWNLIINPLITNLESMSTEICAYADDLAIIIAGKTWDTVQHKANHILKKVTEWARDNALTFNAEKSLYIQYTAQRQVPNLNIIMQNTRLQRTNRFKYLGIMFTDKLKWKAHISYIVNKATRNLMTLQGIVNRNWGLKGKYLRILYLGAIEPILTHGCIVWANGLNNKENLKSLRRIQRLSALMINRANKKSHYLDLLMLAGITPIELRVKELSMRCWAGICSDADESCKEALDQITLHKEQTRHLSAIQQMEVWQRQLGLELNDFEIEHSAMRTRLKDKTPAGLIATTQDESVELKLRDATILYFTDGSKSDVGVGAAYTKWKNDIQIGSWASPLHPSFSNYKAEMIAIKNALEDARHEDSDNIAIISDSQATLSALKSPSRDKMTESIRLKLKMINRSKTVKIGWTKAHVGDKGNESADLLAKAISKSGPINCRGKLNKLEVVHLIKNQIRDEWQYLWDSRRMRWSYRWSNKIGKKMRLESFSNYETELLSNFVCGSIALNEKKTSLEAQK